MNIIKLCFYAYIYLLLFHHNTDPDCECQLPRSSLALPADEPLYLGEHLGLIEAELLVAGEHADEELDLGELLLQSVTYSLRHHLLL